MDTSAQIGQAKYHEGFYSHDEAMRPFFFIQMQWTWLRYGRHNLYDESSSILLRVIVTHVTS